MFRCANPSSRPVAGLRLAKYGSAALPLMPLKAPPASRCPFATARVSTSPLALSLKPGTSAPAAVSTAAMFLAAAPPTEEKCPPR